MPHKSQEARRAYMREYNVKNRDKRLARARRDWANRDPVHERAMRRKFRYGVTPEQFDQMIAAQNNRCAICSEAFKPINKKLAVHIDHCHETKRVRGILCARCNVGIGLFGDNPERLLKAVSYLTDHGG